MKYLYLIIICLSSFSCGKEVIEKTLKDYEGFYIVESIKTKYVYNNSFTCYTGMDSLQIHIADSIKSTEKDFFADTIIGLDTIEVIASSTSENIISILGLFNNWNSDSCFFSKSADSQKIKFIYTRSKNGNSLIPSENNNSILEKDNIQIDFRCYYQNFPSFFTYKGIAKKIQ